MLISVSAIMNITSVSLHFLSSIDLMRLLQLQYAKLQHPEHMEYTQPAPNQSYLHTKNINHQYSHASRLTLNNSIPLGQFLSNLLIFMLQQRQRICGVVPLSLVHTSTKSGRKFLGEVLCMLVL